MNDKVMRIIAVFFLLNGLTRGGEGASGGKGGEAANDRGGTRNSHKVDLRKEGRM